MKSSAAITSSSLQAHQPAQASEQSTRALLFEVLGEISQLEQVYETLLVRVEQIAEKSERDELSSLLRRNAFFTRWRAQIRECVSRGLEGGGILVDVDHFKKINDTQGHAAGDEVIRKLGLLLRDFESVGLICGRYGGEEFAVAYSGSEERGQRLAASIHERVVSIGITVSQGLCHSRRPEEGFEERNLKRADAALYQAKSEGRNRTCTVPSDDGE
jgi:diguanylate cyclase (GGDEF)-like protein